MLIVLILIGLVVFVYFATREPSVDRSSVENSNETSTTVTFRVSIEGGSDSDELPERDTWETDYLVGSEGEIPVSCEAKIKYVDAQGQPSSRSIRVRSLVPWGGDMAILAFCHERNAHRTFLVSRIKEFVDLQSGALVDDVPCFLTDKYLSSPKGKIAGLLSGHAHEVTVLLFVSKADGRLMPKERVEIVSYFHRTGKHSNISGDTLEAELKGLDAPSVLAFRNSLKILSTSSSADKAHLVDTLHRLANTKKNPDSLTVGAVDLAEKELRTG